jgi:hypothetical protein
MNKANYIAVRDEAIRVEMTGSSTLEGKFSKVKCFINKTVLRSAR